MTTSYLPIPARAHRISGRAILAIASAVILLAGCGGSEAAFTSDSVEAIVEDSIRSELEAEGASMDELDCIQDGDEFHWRCTTYLRNDTSAAAVTLSVLCDKEEERCVPEITGSTKIP